MTPFESSSSSGAEPAETSQDALPADVRVGIVVSNWYPEVTSRLEAAAIQTAKDAGVTDRHIVRAAVPGAFELPQAAAWLARSDSVDAIVALGCIVRGDTPHFDHVAHACCTGLMQVGTESGIPVGLGVITANTTEQAEARSGDATGKGGNKGIEAMDAALRMVVLYLRLEEQRRAR